MSARRQQGSGGSLDWDEGVASERTVLAWERTAISSLAVAALVLRAGIVSGPLGLAIPLAVLLVLAAAGEWLFSRRLHAQHDRPYRHGAVLHDREIVALASVTVVAAAGSAWLALA